MYINGCYFRQVLHNFQAKSGSEILTSRGCGMHIIYCRHQRSEIGSLAWSLMKTSLWCELIWHILLWCSANTIQAAGVVSMLNQLQGLWPDSKTVLTTVSYLVENVLIPVMMTALPKSIDISCNKVLRVDDPSRTVIFISHGTITQIILDRYLRSSISRRHHRNYRHGSNKQVFYIWGVLYIIMMLYDIYFCLLSVNVQANGESIPSFFAYHIASFKAGDFSCYFL